VARISANKLAELLVTSSPTRRRRIIHDQKHPSAVIVARYRHAHEPVSTYLTGDRDEQVLADASRRLRADGSGTDWAQEDRRNTADALDHFAEMADGLPNGVVYRPGAADAARMMVAGVSISVRPDFLLTFENRGRRYAGAVKLHFIKNDESALTRTGAEYVAVLMHEWLRQFGPEGHTPAHAHCLSADVFRRSLVTSPRSVSRRLDDITAACEEIAARWPQL
jgi:hypothetical protein